MSERVSSLLYLLGMYMVVFGLCMLGGTILALYTPIHYLLIVLMMDIVATIAIYFLGLRKQTPSFYDPYWSVQTWFFMFFLLGMYKNWNLGTVLVLLVVTFYSVRLTVNFCLGFHDFKYVDWRYKMLREKNEKHFQVINFFGIHMMPTLLVYLASVPFFLYTVEHQFSPYDLIGELTMIGAVLLELFADLQMHKWIKTRTDKAETIFVGLWKFSRHPNYLGEISFWVCGSFLLIPRLINGSNEWYWFSGAVAMILLFEFISIPMIEKHMLSYKPSYAKYRRIVSRLILWPPKKIDGNINKLRK